MSQPSFSSPEAMQTQVDAYFNYCDAKMIFKQVVQKGEIIIVPTPTPPTVIGLCVFLKISRETLNAYKHGEGSGNPRAYSDIVARALDRINDSWATRAGVGCLESKIAGLILSSDFGYTTRNTDTIQLQGIEDICSDLDRSRKGQD